MKTVNKALFFLGVCLSSTLVVADDLESVEVIADRLFKDTSRVSPSSKITAVELQGINITTVEDAIAHEPSLIVRKRFIGDPNGVIGLRGSNMFQTTRSMVFVDGMPLHYHLQTRFSGSPRWSLVSAGEISEVEVLYGPFSAEYSGNAMGGVVNIETRIPTEKKFTLETALFSQFYDNFGTDETFNGSRVFFSYEDKIGDLSLFASYNHLDNESQPMTIFFSEPSSRTATATVNSGPIPGVDEEGNPGVYFGDSGPEEATTDLFKIKLGYDFGDYQFRSSIAYEQRERNESARNNYLRDASGNLVFDRNFTIAGDPNATVYDTTSFGTSAFQNRHQERESLLIGVGLSGLLGNQGWAFDTFYSNFQILEDEEIRTGANPADPNFQNANDSFRGRFTEFDDTGWQILDFKAGTESLGGNDDMRLSIGYHYDLYELEINPVRFNSITGERGAARDSSGGETSMTAIFAQYGYRLSEQWDLSLGLRYEDWEAKNGFTGVPGDAGFVSVPTRTDSAVSPKFSIAYMPTENITWRYSLAKAMRFPIVEELFRNERDAGGAQRIANTTLEPEDGLHHNISFTKLIENGSVEVNLFHEVIEDVIFNSTARDANTSVTSAVPVDEVTTTGVEFIYNQRQVLGSQLNMRFNITYTDAEITENVFDGLDNDPTNDIVGNEFPRMPEWRSHLILGYPLNSKVDINGSLRYASDSSGNLANSDNVDNVFGAHDAFTLLGAKVNWQVTESAILSVGMDNITDEEVYVFHPWPSRTLYVEGKFNF